jgi:hypothetical protein
VFVLSVNLYIQVVVWQVSLVWLFTKVKMAESRVGSDFWQSTSFLDRMLIKLIFLVMDL